MRDYIKSARNGEVALTEAYVQAHNEKMELMKNPAPTCEEFKQHEFITKQIKTLTELITEEAIQKDGYTFNKKTQKWQKSNERKNTA